MAKSSERGAVAVEMALLLPLLLALVLGIAEFGRAFNAQITLTHSAREGVRVMAITKKANEAKAAAINTAVALNPKLDVAGEILINGSCATTGDRVTMTIKYPLDSMTGFIGPFALTGKGVMRCGG